VRGWGRWRLGAFVKGDMRQWRNQNFFLGVSTESVENKVQRVLGSEGGSPKSGFRSSCK
jgi:hypothetical protein